MPTDITSYNQHSRLRKIVNGNRMLADYLVFRLFISLALQARHTRRPGLFERSELDSFLSSLEMAEPAGGFDALLQSRWLEPLGNDFVCRVFADANKHFVHKRVNEPVKRMRALRDARVEASTLQQKLNPECLLGEDGAPIPQDRLNRALVLIRVLDTLFEERVRSDAEFTPGLVNAASRAASRLTSGAMDLTLRRFAEVGRETPEIPHSTAAILDDWKSCVSFITPSNETVT